MKLIFSCLKQIILIFILFLGGKPYLIQGQNSISKSESYYTSQMSVARNQLRIRPDSSYLILNECYRFFNHKKDTSKTVACLLNMAQVQNLKGKYSLSFDHLWEAQYILRNQDKSHEKAAVHIQLARLYDSFNMTNEALQQLEGAVRVSKLIYKDDKNDTQQLVASYMNLAVINRKLNNYAIALSYLDSCITNEQSKVNKSIEMPFWDAEWGYIMLKQGDFAEAEKHLFASKTNVNEQKADYTPNINMYLGELKVATNQPDSAIFYFNKSLSLIQNKKLSTELESKVLNKLSEVHYSLGRTQRAFHYLSQAKTVADSTLRLKNQTNRELFEIKNTYLESISEKNEQIEQQSVVIRQNKLIQQRLKIILALVVLLGVVLVLVIRMRLKLRKTLIEKDANELQAKIKEERNQAKLESKSKELTSYALQLIDKDTAIDELLKVLQNESISSYKALNNKYRKGSQDLWNEFNLRFTEVNSAFYERLKSKHPNLSVTEQKHCALIKLNFATKEMARILNIETHSVHMSRSRIRKKIGLERSESLEEYIAGL